MYISCDGDRSRKRCRGGTGRGEGRYGLVTHQWRKEKSLGVQRYGSYRDEGMRVKVEIE